MNSCSYPSSQRNTEADNTVYSGGPLPGRMLRMRG